MGASKVERSALVQKRAVDLLVAMGGIELLGHDVAFQHARQLAAAVQSEVEGVQGADAAAKEDLGVLAAQVVLAPFQQAGGHFILRRIAMGQHEIRGADLHRHAVLVFIGAEAGMREAHRTVVLAGHDQPLVVEVKLGKEILFQQVGRDRLEQVRQVLPAPPNGREPGGIRVAKRTIGQHRFNSPSRSFSKPAQNAFENPGLAIGYWPWASGITGGVGFQV